MKLFIKLALIFSLLISTVQAVTFDVLVLPADLTNTKGNYYTFDEASEIISNDIIKKFNATNGKIKSPNLYEVKSKLHKNSELNRLTDTTLKKYQKSNTIDYESLKKISAEFNCKSVLLVSSGVTTNKNRTKRGVWETLEIASLFDISYPYRLETSLVLLDNINDLVMWSNTYSTRLGTNNNTFYAKNYSQAAEQYEKLSLYSKSVIAESASQNILLRFFPKAIRPVETKVENNSGGALRFDKTIPEKPKSNTEKQEDFFGDMIYGI